MDGDEQLQVQEGCSCGCRGCLDGGEQLRMQAGGWVWVVILGPRGGMAWTRTTHPYPSRHSAHTGMANNNNPITQRTHIGLANPHRTAHSLRTAPTRPPR